jgi:two-component system sensor histidine kinase YesM
MDEPIILSISAERDFSEYKPYVNIIIRDTGRGFTEKILEELRSGESMVDDKGNHVGVWNVRRRLELLYGEGAGLSFFNGSNPEGAVVKIKLPIQEEA